MLKLAVLVACLVFNLPSLFFSLWCFVKGLCFGREITRKKRSRSGSGGGTSTIRRQSSFSLTQNNGCLGKSLGLNGQLFAMITLKNNNHNNNYIELTLVFTALCLFGGVMVEIGFFMMQFCVLRDWIRKKEHPFGQGAYHVFLQFTIFFIVFSFTFSFLTLFERLRSTFQNTQHKIPEWMSRIAWLMGLILLIVYITFWLFPTRSMIPSILLGLISIEYLLGCLFLLHGFVSRVFKVAGNVTNLDQALDDKLINVGVKMTVCVGISLLSSLLDFTSLISHSLHCPNQSSCGFYIELYPTFLAQLDIAINSFCILCTLAKSQCYYEWIFGRLHNHCLRWMIKRSKPQPKNLTLDGAKLPSNSVGSTLNQSADFGQ